MVAIEAPSFGCCPNEYARFASASVAAQRHFVLSPSPPRLWWRIITIALALARGNVLWCYFTQRYALTLKCIEAKRFELLAP